MPDLYAHFAGVLGSYFLRVAAAYVLCFLLSRLSERPGRRFQIWLWFLLGSAVYWALVVVRTPVHFSVSAAAAAVLQLRGGTLLSPHNLLLPAAWAPFLARIGPIVIWGYAGGVLLFGGSMLWKHVTLRRALRHAAEPSPELAKLFAEMCRAFGVRRGRVLVLPQLTSPATAGWLRPRILLPEICEQFRDSAQLGDILYHELVHVVRRDYLWATVSDLVRCVLFFHPAVWQARKRMRVQRELACDVAVVSGRPDRRADYAESLTQFARMRMLQPGASLGIDFAASASILGMRVRAVLSETDQRSWWKKGLRSAACLVLLVCFGLLWPVFGIVTELTAPPLAQNRLLGPQPLVRHTHLRRAIRVAKRRHAMIAAPALRAGAFRVQSAPRTGASTRNEPYLSSPVIAGNSGLEPLPDGGAQANDDAVSDGGGPAWTESAPLPRSGASVNSVVQRVASGIAQIGREVEHEGREHGNHF